MKQLAITILLISTTGSSALAEQLVGLTVTNSLVRFDSGSPGVTTTTAITGVALGDRIVGIDVRPFNNVLYGFATDSGAGGANRGAGRIYSINPATGVATMGAALTADLADTTSPNPFSSVEGQFFGVNFNPIADRLRVVSDTGQNLRIEATTGFTQLDVALAYASSDVNNGSPPAVVAVAYSNGVENGGSTTLFGLDQALSTLLTFPGNDGVLDTVAVTSLGVFPGAGFDISGASGIGYVVLDGLTLGIINLSTGVVTEVGAINTTGSIGGLAVMAVPEPSTLVAGAAALVLLSTRRRSRERRRPAVQEWTAAAQSRR